MNSKQRKSKIISQALTTLLVDTVSVTLIIAVLLYFAFYYFFENISLSFFTSILYSLCLSIFIECLFVRKQIHQVKLDIEVVNLHDELNYTNINEILKKEITKIKENIIDIEHETYKKNKKPKVFSISLELNINNTLKKTQILEALKNILHINEQEFINIDVNGMIKFICKSHSLIEFVKNKNNTENSEARNICEDNSDLGWAYALNDELEQSTINIIESLKYKFMALIINEYTIQSTFSAVTSDYHATLIKYDIYCSIKHKLNFKNDMFKTIANEMEVNHRDDCKHKVLLFQIYKLFDDKSLEEFKKILTINYLYLLTESRKKPAYFLDMLYNYSLSYHTDSEILYEFRKRFSKYLFNKHCPSHFYNDIIKIWTSIIEDKSE
ncbi:hypothetical protein [Poseidonibacter ostreae]|uniref:Uncharacterized protein n=1 Tax=Poseidonibacter ostreae TaxID=2654171 RepID=A0ABQ6VJ00_9BACT|nr:hypothetical protein [Poseidonibacter ostreae]KAB7884900.1 hypothetical protein GA417_10125 [Poseidonibacter ostreae]KAB7888955.1 hypothetical protein GBG18_12035 [Poseidonibacter ostreae]